MVNKQKIKKLALVAASSSTIPADIEQYVLKYLGKQELKIFLNYYKSALNKKRVYVSSAGSISPESMKLLKGLYKEKEIIEINDDSLGAGIKVLEDDMVVDFTFKKYIEDTIEKLKN